MFGPEVPEEKDEEEPVEVESESPLGEPIGETLSGFPITEGEAAGYPVAGGNDDEEDDEEEEE